MKKRLWRGPAGDKRCWQGPVLWPPGLLTPPRLCTDEMCTQVPFPPRKTRRFYYLVTVLYKAGRQGKIHFPRIVFKSTDRTDVGITSQSEGARARVGRAAADLSVLSRDRGCPEGSILGLVTSCRSFATSAFGIVHILP